MKKYEGKPRNSGWWNRLGSAMHDLSTMSFVDRHGRVDRNGEIIRHGPIPAEGMQSASLADMLNQIQYWPKGFSDVDAREVEEVARLKGWQLSPITAGRPEDGCIVTPPTTASIEAAPDQSCLKGAARDS